MITRIKAATIKNKDRKKDFHGAGLPLPPSECFPVVRTTFNNWTGVKLLVS